jgi:glyoxylate carboligase
MERKAQAAACYYDVLEKSSAIHALPVTIDALIEIVLLLLDISELEIAFDILRAVQLYPAMPQDSRVRIEGILARMSETSAPIKVDGEGVANDLQLAVEVALKAKTLLQRS